MKLKICFLMALSVAVALAEGPAPKRERAKKDPAPPAELTLPAGAKMVEPGTYTFTDPQGKKWIYRKTPFGLAKLEDKPADTSSAPAAAAGSEITAREDGDTVRFERPGPFGVYKWQKKKSELADDEKAAWQRSRKAKKE